MSSSVTVFDKSTPGSYSVRLSPGVYQIDTYGAKGGDGIYRNEHCKDGKGGHSAGKIKIESIIDVFAFVGGSGSFGTSSSSVAKGGFNGGGDGITIDGSNTAGGGGGASDIRLKSNDLYTRIIVAGAGRHKW